MSRENLSLVLPTSSEAKTAVQPQKMVRGLKFWIYEVEELYYLCSENKGADQLQGYCAADLRHCFPICKKQVFSGHDSNNERYLNVLRKPATTKLQISCTSAQADQHVCCLLLGYDSIIHLVTIS